MSNTSQNRKTLGMRVLAGLMAGLAALLAQPLVAQAQDRSWQVADSAWVIPGNWTGGVVPTISNGAWINNGGTARLGTTASADALHVGSTNGGANTFRLQGGSFVSNAAFAGESEGSFGTFWVSSGTWVNTSAILVGNSGTGNFLLSGGFVSSAAAQFGGASAGTGTMTVSGGTFAVTNVLLVGSDGKGSLAISDGLVSSGTTIVAAGVGSSGTLTLSGSTFSGTVLSNGTLVTGQVMSGSGQAAFQASGGTLRLTQDQSALFSGFANGKVQIGSGGLTLDTVGYNAAIATGMAGTGTLTKVGTGTLTLTGSSSYGDTWVRDGALVLDGGSLTNSGTIALSGSTGSLLEVKGAFVSASDIDAGRDGIGTIKLSSGYVTGDSLHVGINPNGEGTAIMTGGTMVLSGNLTVAAFGATGHLEISGGVVSSEKAILADKGGTGTALVSGGTWNNSGLFWLGAHGTGTLTISGSGLVNTPEMYVARIGGSVGTFNLDGGVFATGSILEGAGTGTVNLNGGTLRLTQNQSALFTDFESGDVTIGNGGFFLDTAGYNAGIAASLAGTGTLTKVGAGTLTLSGSNTYAGGTKIEVGTLIISDVGGGHLSSVPAM